MREFFKRKGIVFPLGIALLITNYFCGNKSVFAKPSMYAKVLFRSFALQKPNRKRLFSIRKNAKHLKERIF